ncbi:MAG TPA: DNA polymerase III subunit delta [Fimbriimonas sp.]|nr:DNA polymerase III subunit delta [Fimbriimonas sp.]
MSAVEKALKKSVVLIAGDEEILRRRALDGLLALANVQPDDFDLELMDAPSRPAADWVASAGTAPFLAERRTVVVRHLMQSDPDKAKNVGLAQLPPTSLLILVADEEGGSEDRTSRMKTNLKAWEKMVSDSGGAVLRFDQDAKVTHEEVKAEAKKMGRSMPDRVVSALVEMTGGSLSRALEELEKLSLYVGPSESIGERELRAIVVPSRDWNVFKMTDAIVSNNVPEALRQLGILVGSAAKAEDAAYRQILPQLSRSLRLLWQGRICADHGCLPSTAPGHILAAFPVRPNLAKEQPYRQTQVMTTARKTSLAAVAKALQVLSDTDARLKGGLPSFSPVDTLERMVLEMAAALRV